MSLQQIQRSTVTVREIAIYLNVSVDKVYEMVRRKEIPHFKIGRRILFKLDVIDEWIDERMNEGII